MSYRFALAGCLVLLLLGWFGYQALTLNAEQHPINAWMPGALTNTRDIDSAEPSAFTAKPLAEPDKLPPTSRTLPDVSKELSDSESKRPVHTPMQMWQTWASGLIRGDYHAAPIISAHLSDSMHQHPDPQVYHKIRQLLTQTDIPDSHKAMTLDLLSELSTPESLTLLIDLAEQSGDSPLLFFVLQAISRIGENRWEGRFHEELSPVLEKAWSNPKMNNKAFLSAIGRGLSTVGAPKGVESLLSSLLDSDEATTNELNRIKQEVALTVIPEITNPNAIEVLSPIMEQAELDTAALEIAGSALANISTPQATEKLIDWATNTSAEGARVLETWLLKINDSASIEMLSNAQSLDYQSSEIQTVVAGFASSNVSPDLGDGSVKAANTSRSNVDIGD